MRNNRTDWFLLGMSLCGFAFMACSFILMPFESAGILVPGWLFWGGLITGVGFQIVLEIRRRAFFKSYNVKIEKMQKQRNGLLSFGSNKWARIADNAMIISFIATLLALIFSRGSGLLCYGFIAATLFFFCLHCILNGRIFSYEINQTKIRQKLEKRQKLMIKEREKNEQS